MCVAPVKIKDTTGVTGFVYMTVPCGKCHECRSARSAGWAFRLEQEMKLHLESHFITLTYNDENLNWVGDEPTLSKNDLQRYWKRVRKRLGKSRVKYYACGEYGTTTLRPHYHAVVFGAPPAVLEDCWSDGNIFFGDVSSASIRYVTNYLCKSPNTNLGNRLPEFALMSKGLGKNYLTPQMIRWHEENLANYCVGLGGVKMRLPRYYKDRIWDVNQKQAFGREYANKIIEAEQKTIAKIGYEKFVSLQVQIKGAAIAAADYKQKNRNKL